VSGARDLQLDPAQQDLKVASKALIRAYGGQIPAGALLGRVQSRYCDAGAANTATFLTIHEVAELEDRTSGSAGHPIVTRTLARRQGFELVALPRALPCADDMLACVSALLKEGGDVMAAVGEALRDGKWNKNEARNAGEQADELIAVAVTLRAALTAIENGDA
jgi:hypothetical protein